MPVAGEPLDPSNDPTSSTRWSFANPSDPPLPEDDPAQNFCARHAHTIARLTKTYFSPHQKVNGLPPSLRDWHFGSLNDNLVRRQWCRACALISNVIDDDLKDQGPWRDQAEIIACWVWDGELGDGKTASLRLRIAPEMVGWEDLFEPFDLVPLDTSESAHEKSMFSGRAVMSDQFDLSLVKSWITSCAEWHGHDCVDTTPWKTSDWDVPFIRLISLTENMIVEKPSPPPYIALSYVWGTAPVFRTLQDNINESMKPGGLPFKKFPKSIRDAITLSRALGFQYIWIDSLCIIQDSDADKAQQIRLMDAIYSRASLAIVAAAGPDANAGIPGLVAGSRERRQHSIKISDNLTLVALQADTHRKALTTAWNTRGWTYQERLLSRRCLFSFPDGSVGFQCSKAVWGEDYRAETSLLKRCAPMMDISLNRSWMFLGSAKERGLHTVRTQKTPYLQEYSRLVEEYTGRNMSYPGDRLPGISGVLDVLKKEFGLRFIQGLPSVIIHMTLLWQPRSKVKRIAENEKTGVPLFPSWSWAGWIGPIGYENWNEFNGLPELEERGRRVIPFAKIGVAGSKALEYFSPTEENKLPDGWSKASTGADGTNYVFGGNVNTYHSVPFISPPAKLSSASYALQPSSLTLRTRVAKFRITILEQSSDLHKMDHTIEKKGRFGLSLPSPASGDQPWLGSILLPVQYHSPARKSQDHEFIILSESYGFNRQEMEPVRASRMQPFEVYDVMMIRRIVGEELIRYETHFALLADSSKPSTASDWWQGKTVVERIGVGRMMKSAWKESEFEEFILV
ncbi:hypothetical protein PT974_09744 [Cladobotryum mycophilum]|uniref:Heterokaryon incompatibility domain-containing protein n=1 Tax=Cladobotryum mycophilum TaxID=491253 RepID=A0ABR0SH07_9HYPO